LGGSQSHSRRVETVAREPHSGLLNYYYGSGIGIPINLYIYQRILLLLLLLLLLRLLSFVLSSMTSSELICNYGSYRQSVGLLGRGSAPSQGRYLHKHRINADRPPCLEWDSNSRSQCLRGGRRLVNNTARPLMTAVNLSLYLTTAALRPEYVWGSGCIHPRVAKLSTSWR
jgi:hypothetical protein